MATITRALLTFQMLTLHYSKTCDMKYESLVPLAQMLRVFNTKLEVGVQIPNIPDPQPIPKHRLFLTTIHPLN